MDNYCLKRWIFVTIILFASSHWILGQQNEMLVNPQSYYTDGIRAFENGSYAEAVLDLDAYLINESHDSWPDLLNVNSMIYLIKTAYENDQESADEMLENLENNIPDHILLHEAYFVKGNYYFREKNYTEAINTYKNIRLNLLNREAENNIKFKLAYSYFVKKRFDEAAVLFDELSYLKSDYYFPSNYYLGICQFLRSDFNDAIRSFKVVEKTKEYRPHIPYYLVQLYFAQDKLETTINYGKEQLDIPGLKNTEKIHHIIGASYFIQENFEEALPHFEEYEKNSAKLSQSDFYQLGFIYYQLGAWEKAIPNFLELSDVGGAYGQNANYYLADCYIRTEEKHSARNALKKVTEIDIDNNMREESFLNFGKLSAEMGYDREAIDALFRVASNSLHYNEAQDILGQLFVQTLDYAKAQQILEARDEVSHQLFEAYQKVCYYKGLQMLQNDDLFGATEDFTKAIKTDRDLSITARSYYWLAEIAQRQEKYLESSHRLIKYFLLIKGVEEIAGQAAPAFAHYVQGYNYIKLDQYQAALDEFTACLHALPSTNEVDKDLKYKILLNAKLRAGDCALKSKEFDTALDNYEFIIDRKTRFTPYALFQKAIIMHLTQNIYGSISILQKIVQDYPKSDMLALSLMHLGDLYVELNEPSKAYDAYLGLVNSQLNGNLVKNEAYLKLGLLSYNMGDIQKANGFYQEVLKNNPSGNERKEALEALEEIYVNDLNRAGDYVALASDLGGVSLETLYQDSISYVAAKNTYDKDSTALAIESFNSYLEQFPNGYFSVEAHYFRGESLVQTEEFLEAYDDFIYVRELGSGEFYEDACYKAAVIAFNNKKDYRNAYRIYAEIETNASNEERKYEAQLGALRSAYNNYDLAATQKYTDKVLNNALSSQKEKASAHYYLGKVAYKHDKFDASIRAFNNVIHQFKNSNLAAESRYLIARIYFERQELGLAEELCKNANTYNSAYPYWIAKSLILLSDILVEKGDLFNARAALEATIENYRENKEIFTEASSKLEKIVNIQNEKSRLEKENSDGTIKMDTIEE